MLQLRQKPFSKAVTI